MAGRIGWGAAALAVLLAGCAPRAAEVEWTPVVVSEPLPEWSAVRAEVRRNYAYSFQDSPFAEGPISVVAPDHDEMRTYRLVPCGTTICAGSERGTRGTLEVTPDYLIVRGLYGAEFWLSPGGDGGLLRAGRPGVSLAWETVEM